MYTPEQLITHRIVLVRHEIEDYRPAETGLQLAQLANGLLESCSVFAITRTKCRIVAPYFQDVQLRVAGIIKNKILVGHCGSFLKVLGLSHPALRTRDLALFRPLRRKLKSRSIIALSSLVYLFMGRSIGMDYENPVRCVVLRVRMGKC